MLACRVSWPEVSEHIRKPERSLCTFMAALLRASVHLGSASPSACLPASQNNHTPDQLAMRQSDPCLPPVPLTQPAHASVPLIINKTLLYACHVDKNSHTTASQRLPARQPLASPPSPAHLPSVPVQKASTNSGLCTRHKSSREGKAGGSCTCSAGGPIKGGARQHCSRAEGGSRRIERQNRPQKQASP